MVLLHMFLSLDSMCWFQFCGPLLFVGLENMVFYMLCGCRGGCVDCWFEYCVGCVSVKFENICITNIDRDFSVSCFGSWT